MKILVKYPGALIICAWLLTLLLWIAIGILSFRYINPHTFAKGIEWLLIWNFLSFMINTIILYLVSTCVEE
jgi:hypothetical protein